ncbi:MAG: RNase H family protein [Candidatus Poseidoniales archaeon]|jgi:ribonuclease HI|tara:strand:+ start:958 stop:1494 length:537 start_codon:yes stop_codon:yes gene_type:complete
MALNAIYLYVDGSCEENRNVTSETPAGWGFCVIEGDSGLGRGHGDLIYEESGKVETHSTSKIFLGAEVGSNNTAELSAIALALRWLLLEGTERPAVIRGDSQYAMNIANGTWKAKANRDLASTVQKLWQEVRHIKEIKCEHVRAHRGHRWNERADHLAFRAMKGNTALPLQFWKPGKR